jgi:hypothetical protein
MNPGYVQFLILDEEDQHVTAIDVTKSVDVRYDITALSSSLPAGRKAREPAHPEPGAGTSQQWGVVRVEPVNFEPTQRCRPPAWQALTSAVS